MNSISLHLLSFKIFADILPASECSHNLLFVDPSWNVCKHVCLVAILLVCTDLRLYLYTNIIDNYHNLNRNINF